MPVYPIFRYKDADAAMAFLEKAFGFEPTEVHRGSGGAIEHAEMRVAGGTIMLGQVRGDGSAFDDFPGRGFCYVGVPEVDELCARARAAGAEIFMEPSDTDYGSRDFGAKDSEGNRWSFGTYAP